jgi:hypothetical protein
MLFAKFLTKKFDQIQKNLKFLLVLDSFQNHLYKRFTCRKNLILNFGYVKDFL